MSARRRGPVPGSSGRPKALIAAIATAAHADNRPMVDAVMAHFGCTRRAAGAAISRARLAGWDIPLGYGRNQHGYTTATTADQIAAWRRAIDRRETVRARRRTEHPTPAGDGPVRCACGQEYATRTLLGRHCWAAHERPPTDAERILLAVEVAA